MTTQDNQPSPATLRRSLGDRLRAEAKRRGRPADDVRREFVDAEPLPEFILYPLPDQVADKVCAMYSRYGATGMSSTRYRDLVDLVLIATTNELDARLTTQAIQGEAARRGCALPAQFDIPGPEWRAGYACILLERLKAPTAARWWGGVRWWRTVGGWGWGST